MVDHKAKLEENVLATLSRRDMMRGMGAGSLAIAAGTMRSGSARAEGGHIKLAWIDHIDTLDPHFTSFFGAIKINNNI